MKAREAGEASGAGEEAKLISALFRYGEQREQGKQGKGREGLILTLENSVYA